jgi:DNA-directed RNA polymerase subunit M/transcription elongation factor TFIIS
MYEMGQGNILHTVPSAVSDDPTLARSQQANCANCGHHEAVFFQSDTNQSDSLALIFVCCNCDHKVRSEVAGFPCVLVYPLAPMLA